jgi:hypothetical protein
MLAKAQPVATKAVTEKILVVSVFLTALCKRLTGFSDPNFIGTFSDDFFYYLEVAIHFAAGQGSTFDGSIPTNGYHPLWMLVVAALVRILGSGQNVLVLLAIFVAAATALTFVLARRVAGLLLGSDGLVATLIGLYGALYFYVIGKHGMEIVVSVPLALYFVLRMLRGGGRLTESKDALVTGLLAAILVLSRLDSLLYVAVFLLGWSLIRRPFSSFLRSGVFFTLGFSPVFVYLATNLAWFEGLLPVSGAAKQLAESPLQHVVIRGFEVSPRFHAAFVFPPLAANLLGLAVLIARWRALDPFLRQVVLLPVFCFPPAFYLLQISQSDWPFWDWYLYPWMVAAPPAIAFSFEPWRSYVQRLDARAKSMRWGVPLVRAVALLPVVVALLAFRKPLGESPIHAFAKALETFAETHPGRYAMGDRAGMVGYLLPHPLLQLEGLVEDRRYLEHIRKERDLKQVLNEYGVDYYASSSARRVGNCYQTEEPFKAGPGSPRMRGQFCQEPVLVFRADYDGTVTIVLDLKKARTGPPH